MRKAERVLVQQLLKQQEKDAQTIHELRTACQEIYDALEGQITNPGAVRLGIRGKLFGVLNRPDRYPGSRGRMAR